MRHKNYFILNLIIFVLLTFVFPFEVLSAADPINVEAVVNVLDSSDSNNVGAAIKKANDVLGQAGIKLVPVKVNKPFNVGNNDDTIESADGPEGEESIEEGEDELDNTCGSGNGVKINIANDVWHTAPSTNGWAIHRVPVVAVEPDSDVNVMGKTIAHEICHSLTLGYDLYDANDVNNLMYGYTNRGAGLTSEQIAEIRKGAEKRVPSWFGRMMRRLWRQVTGVKGAELDGLNDLTVNGIVTNISGFPQLGFLDIRTVSAFCKNPSQPGAELVFEIMLNGDFPPPESFFDITYEVDINKPARPLPPPTTEPNAVIRIWNNSGTINFMAEYRTETGLIMPIPMFVHLNDLLYDHDDPAIPSEKQPSRHSIEVRIPLVFMELDDSAFVDGITLHATQEALILSPIEFIVPGSIVIDDTDEMEVKITQPCKCREITMVSSGVAGTDPQWPDKPKFVNFYGCGFNGDVSLYINSDLMGISVADSEGNVNIRVDVSSFEEGNYEILLQEQLSYDGSTVDRADYSIGYLDLRPDIEGDINDDGQVNFLDFAKLADNWLI